jgi:2-polyprenyl-6-methoxyphenol hydroxylase-like FAD-dependent oxidoreductase
VLAKCLRDVPSVAEAFGVYEGLRRDRVERVVAQGKRNGDAKAPGPVGRVVRDLVLPVVMRRLASKDPMGWIFDYDVDWETPVRTAVGSTTER